MGSELDRNRLRCAQESLTKASALLLDPTTANITHAMFLAVAAAVHMRHADKSASGELVAALNEIKADLRHG